MHFSLPRSLRCINLIPRKKEQGLQALPKLVHAGWSRRLTIAYPKINHNTAKTTIIKPVSNPR